MSIDGADQILPPFKVDKVEFEFYRDPEHKDTLVLLEGDNTQYSFVNPLDVPGKYGSQELFSMQFGAYGTTQLLVYARGLEDAIEEAAGWLAEFAPGHIMDHGSDELKELYDEAKEELGADAEEHEIDEKATADLTYTESGYLTSYEWWGGEARGALQSAAEYAAKALHAAEYQNYDMIPIRPLGKGEGERVELDEADILKLYADGDLGLTQQDIERITDAEEGAVIDLKGFKLERVG